MDKAPSRWDLEVRVVTPDHRVVINRVSHPPEYMDESLLEYILDKLVHSIKHELKTEGDLS